MYTRVQRDISMIVSLKIYAFVKIKDQWKLSRWRQLSLRFTLTPALKFFHVDLSSQFVSRWHQLSNSFTLTSALKSFHAYISSQFLSRWRHISNPVMVTSALKSFQGDTSPKIRWRWRQLSSFFTLTSALKCFTLTSALKSFHVDVSPQIISCWRQLSYPFTWPQLYNLHTDIKHHHAWFSNSPSVFHGSSHLLMVNQFPRGKMKNSNFV